MILVLLLVSKLIHSIHGIDVCPPAPPFDPTCLARLIMPGCSSDQDCTKPGTKCCRSDCGVLQCVQSIQGVIKVGICPPLPPIRPGFCLAARISSDCDGNDANCPGQKKCCPTICGSQNCRDPITEERKECPAVPVPGAQCFRFDQQCSSDLDCPKSQICCGVICGTGCRDPVVPYTPPIEDPRPGVCPPVKPGVICNALLISDCTGKDSECTTPGYKCCPGACNSQRCQEPITGDRPGCLAINPDLRCIVFRQQCNSDRDCDEGQQCCFQPSCGTSCQAVTPLNPMCPPYRKDVVCIHFDEQCTTNDDCKVGDICCTIECGTACKTPYRPPYEDPQCKPVLCDLHCDIGFARDGNGCEICRCSQKTCPPRVQLCINIPSGACSKENFLIIDGGVRCPLCPSIIPCNKDCLLPVQPGPCRGAFKRYYYNVDTNSCTEFVYGGCQGNNNNFNSLQECEEKCSTNPTVPVEKPGKCPYNNNPDQNCVGPVRPAECQDDSGCPGERKCCRVGCFQVCIDPEPVCPPVCAIFCEFGNVVDSYGCPTCKCRDKPCPPDPTCPIPPLVPPGECPRRCRFVYEDIDGVSCKVRCELGPAGPTVLPCLHSNCIQEPTDPHPPPLPACEKGIPLVSIQCGLGGQLCPSGYYCDINWCCQIPCKNGTPHPTLTCGQVAGSNNCPTGYSCLAHPADAYFACCPDDSSGNCPNGSPLPNYFCGRGPSHQDCPSGFSCNTDPADRFAVCCPDITGNCPNGNPLPNYFCGRGPSHQDCPPGYSCNTDPADRFAVCCPDRMKYGSCPPVKPDTAGICVELCSGDASCPGKEKCCSNGCGHVCTNPTEEHICALIKCPVNCEYGYELDNYGCQTCNCKPDPCPKPVCIPPPEGSCTEADYKIYNGVKCMWCPKLIECKPQPCPLPSCVPPPPLSCTEPDFKIFNGVKCPWCPRIVPCKPSCEAGMPLPNINCGLRSDRQDCPAGFFCNVDPIDRFAVCCPECTRGKPLPNVLCDDVNRKCPSGYQCKKIHGICCPTPCLPPPCPPPPQGACIEPQFTIIDGVTCPACYKIVPCKDKLCPAVPAESRCYEYTKECKDDNSCTDGRKCCRQGCSYVCLNPV